MHTLYKEEYDEMAHKLNQKIGREMYQIRMHTVEPVFGTLQQHDGLRWINTRGIDCANNLMLMCAAALNLKKWMKNELNRIKIKLFRLIFQMRYTIGFEVIHLRNF